MEEYTGSESDLIIPENIVKIGTEAFRGNSNIESIILPQGLTHIGMDAFRNCSRLTSISIPKNTVHIGIEAFYGCTALEKVEIMSKTISIGKECFNKGNSGLTIFAIQNSTAIRYAKENNIKYQILNMPMN